MEIRQILLEYEKLLASADRWFDTCASAAGEAIACRKAVSYTHLTLPTNREV